MTRYVRLRSVLIASLLVLAVGACSGDVDWRGGDEEAQQIRSAIAPKVPGTPKVDVERSGDEKRRIDITVTGVPTDTIGVKSLAVSDSIEQTLKDQAMAIVRTLNTSYEHADRIEQVEISFMKEAALGPVRVSTGRSFTFEGPELDKL